MPGKNKTPLIGWHSADPTLKDWITAEAARRDQTIREFLDKALADIRAGHMARSPGKPPAPESPRRSRKPRAAEPESAPETAPRRRCPHPGTRVIGGYCPKCDHLTEPGGYWR